MSATTTRSDVLAAGMIFVGGALAGKLVVDAALDKTPKPKTAVVPVRGPSSTADDVVAVGAFVFGTYMLLGQLPELIAQFRKVAP